MTIDSTDVPSGCDEEIWKPTSLIMKKIGEVISSIPIGMLMTVQTNGETWNGESKVSS
jgi:hypothetical protein